MQKKKNFIPSHWANIATTFCHKIWDRPVMVEYSGCYVRIGGFVTTMARQIIKKARELQKNIYFCSIDYAKAFDCVEHNKLWKILKQMGIPDHLTCLLRNLYAGQEATVRTRHGTTDWFQIGKGVRQGCILSPWLFNLYAEYIMKTLGWMKHKLESGLLGEISITSDMQMTPPLWQKVKRY